LIQIRTSEKPAGVPGNYFRQKTIDRHVRYFTAYIDEQPVGQMALLRRGQLWWIDYLYVQKEFRGHGVVPALIKVIFPAAAQVTDYTWEQCEGVTAEDLSRNSKRYALKMDVLRTYFLEDGRPCTLVRRHVAPLRRPQPEAQLTA
jgi:predicted GNAT family acetyltransferase